MFRGRPTVVTDQLPALLSSTEGIDRPPNRRIAEPRITAELLTGSKRAGDRPDTCEPPKIDTAPNPTLRNTSWSRAPVDGADEDPVEGTASPAALTPQLQRREPEAAQLGLRCCLGRSVSHLDHPTNWLSSAASRCSGPGVDAWIMIQGVSQHALGRLWPPELEFQAGETGISGIRSRCQPGIHVDHCTVSETIEIREQEDRRFESVH
jgi:hypothetical protein